MVRDDVEVQVVKAIKSVLAERKKSDIVVTRASPIDARLGLESLEWATVIVHLESELGVDPFREGFIGQLGTVGDIADLYQAMLNGKKE